MIIHNILNKLFSSSASISILRELSLRNTGTTGRELAKFAQLTPQAAHNTLSNLELLNIVQREHAGKSHYFWLNRKHYLTKHIIETVFQSEKDYKEKLFTELKKAIGKESESIILFGSVARKEETPQSDLDICIVHLNKKKIIENKISQLRQTLYDQFGITLAPYYITKPEFIKKCNSDKSPVNNIVKEGKVISGISINRLIHG